MKSKMSMESSAGYVPAIILIAKMNSSECREKSIGI